MQCRASVHGPRSGSTSKPGRETGLQAAFLCALRQSERGQPLASYLGIGPTSSAGSIRRSKRFIRQSRCGPVERPVDPTSAMGCPCVTRSPSSTRMRDRWRKRRRQSVPVVDDHGAPGEEHVRMHEGDHTIGRRDDLRTGGRRYVDPEVRATRLTVENALRAVDAA